MVTDKSGKQTFQQQKRIASNTLVLFLRVFVITIVNLYTVRLVLNGLGELDYGIYNAIAGIVLTSTCFIPVLSLSLQRFYSYALGKNDKKQLQTIFSASINITILFSVIVFVLFETIGLWFMYTHMTIPQDRIIAAQWIFQCALFSFLFTIMQIPFSACIFAHEDMGFYALFSLFDCILKLGIAISIGYFFSDNLMFYGTGILGVAFILLLLYAITGHIKYSECRYKKVVKHNIYKQLLSFSGWTLYSSLAGVGLIQGSTIILNVFFGPLINAAFAIANNLYNAFNSLSNSIVLAFRAPMIKSYAANKFDFLDKLFFANNKFILYLLTIVSIPIIIEMNTILTWWLGTATEESVLFAKLFVIYTVCLTMHNPITTIVQASGQLKRYYLLTDTLNLMHLPITFVLFYMGKPAQWILYTMISICIIAYIIRLVCFKQIYIRFSYKTYISKFLIPSITIIIISVFVANVIKYNIVQTIPQFLSIFILSPITTIILIYLIGLTESEKSSVWNYIKNRSKK